MPNEMTKFIDADIKRVSQRRGNDATLRARFWEFAARFAGLYFGRTFAAAGLRLQIAYIGYAN